MEVGTEHRRTFAKNGYLVLHEVVHSDLVDAALTAINHWLGADFDSTELAQYRSRSYAPELCYDDVIVGLILRSGAFEVAETLVGRPLVKPSSAQIALRFPGLPGTVTGGPWPHLDGIATSSNGVPADGRVHGFTLLAGILLSDLPGPERGNLTVWPGTHLVMAKWFAEHGTSVANPESFLEDVVRLASKTSEPHGVTGRAGDLVLCHHLLLHGVGPHLGPHVRYSVYFRLSSEGRTELGDNVLMDPWAEWDGLRAGFGASTPTGPIDAL